MSKKTKVLFMGRPGDRRDELWTDLAERKAEQLGFELRLNPLAGNLSERQWRNLIAEEEALITTWGVPTLDEAILAGNDRLRIVGHAAGSVANIVSDALYARGVRVVTANPVMARAVAEWCLMMTLVAARQLQRYSSFAVGQPVDASKRHLARSPWQLTVGVWGYGDVARQYIDMLRPFQPGRLLVSDPYASPEEAEAKGFECVDLKDLFAQCDIVQTLTGLTAETRGQVSAEILAQAKPGCTVINAGRAALIEREPFLKALREGRLNAILDVHYNEPAPADDPFLALPNVIMTPHCAGRPGRELYVPTVLEEFARFFDGQPLRYEVSAERAAAMTDARLVREARQ